MTTPRVSPPRIGPISDFYGAVVPPDSESCNGLITHPVRTLTLVRYESYSLAANLQSQVNEQDLFVTTGSVTADTNGFANAGASGTKIPAGLNGFYAWQHGIILGVSVALASVNLVWTTTLFRNSTIEYEDVYNLGTVNTPGSNFSKDLFVPIFGPWAVGDIITVYERLTKTGGSGVFSANILALSIRYDQLNFLGS